MNRSRYLLFTLALAGAAGWLAFGEPAPRYQLRAGEAELETVSIGALEVGMPVRLADEPGPAGTVLHFIRRDEGGRSADLAVVQWSEGAPRAVPLTALQPLDAGVAPHLATR